MKRSLGRHVDRHLVADKTKVILNVVVLHLIAARFKGLAICSRQSGPRRLAHFVMTHRALGLLYAPTPVEYSLKLSNPRLRILFALLIGRFYPKLRLVRSDAS